MACWRSSAYIVIRLPPDSVDRVCVYVVLRPNVLTVKGRARVTCDHGHHIRLPAPVLLRGTPVVPGVAYAPAPAGPRRGLARRDRRASTTGGFADADAALAAYDEAVGAVADGLRRQGRQGIRRRGRGADRQRRAGPRQGPARRGPQGARARATTCSPPCTRPSTSSPAIFTGMGGLMAERVTDLRDIERRVVARLVGEPEPGVPAPTEPVGAGRRGPRARRHRRPATRARGRAGHRARRPDQPHRDHRPPARHPLRGRRRRRHGHPGRHAGCWSTAPPAPSSSTRTPAEAERRVARGRRGQRAALAAWTGPGRPPTARRSRSSPTSPTASRARSAADAPVEGVGLFRTELCFLNRKEEPTVEEQAEIYGEVLEPFGRRRATGTSSSAPSTPARTSRSRSRRCEGEENPALGVRGLRLSFDNPGLLDRQLDAIALAARDDRHRDLGDGADGGDRRRGDGLRRRRCASAG